MKKLNFVGILVLILALCSVLAGEAAAKAKRENRVTSVNIPENRIDWDYNLLK